MASVSVLPTSIPPVIAAARMATVSVVCLARNNFTGVGGRPQKDPEALNMIFVSIEQAQE